MPVSDTYCNLQQKEEYWVDKKRNIIILFFSCMSLINLKEDGDLCDKQTNILQAG